MGRELNRVDLYLMVVGVPEFGVPGGAAPLRLLRDALAIRARGRGAQTARRRLPDIGGGPSSPVGAGAAAWGEPVSDRTRGLLLGIGASVLWSSVFVAGRYVTTERGVDPVLTATARFTIGAVGALLYLLVTGRGARLRRAFEGVLPLSILGAIGIFAMGLLVFISTSLTTSINGAIILNSNAVFIGVFALFIGERVPPSASWVVDWPVAAH